MVTVAHFDVAKYADELQEAPTNFDVATRLVFENDRIRVWDMHLQPGQRMPFHCHRTPYFWICHAGGRGIQRFPDGTLWHVEFAPGDVDFIDKERLEAERIHDFENAGETTARFTTFELLDY
jgi:beta-alanine degradation protein BauB